MRRPEPFHVPAGAVLCLFGLGVMARECYAQIVQMLGREPDCLCDNDPAKWGSRVEGIPCISPSELASRTDGVFVAVAARFADPILAQLRGLGMENIAVIDYERACDRVRGIRPASSAFMPSLPVLPVAGRWVLVTGASRGLGRLIALDMARRGGNLVLMARDISHLDDTAHLCSMQGGRVVTRGADLARPDLLQVCLDGLKREVADIAFVFNNAAISPSKAKGLWAISSEDYTAAFRVNALAPALICQALVPGMIGRGFGRIVNVSTSIQGRVNEMAYACSKAALDKFVRDLAIELAGTGVMACLADPGWMRTDMGGAKAPSSAESALPGVLLGGLLDADVNGLWFTAQDYAGMDLESAARRARAVYGLDGGGACG